MQSKYNFTVNGVLRGTDEDKPLLRYLRDDLHLHSVKDGCSEGACGTCTVILRSSQTAGPVTLTASSPGMKSIKLKLNTNTI
jgi:aerobic-type carbon monoxide dehydrogenase small subunit (CoxS/CutS family)